MHTLKVVCNFVHMNERYISHPQDLSDAVGEIKNLRYPFMLVTTAMPPKKEHSEEWEKKQRQMAYFHRSVVAEYAKVAGITEEEAKYELMIKLSRVGEIKESGGEFDVVWLEQNKLRVFEEGKRYYVQSIADMSNAELADLIERSKNYLLQYYGVRVKEYVRNYKTKEL